MESTTLDLSYAFPPNYFRRCHDRPIKQPTFQIFNNKPTLGDPLVTLDFRLPIDVSSTLHVEQLPVISALSGERRSRQFNRLLDKERCVEIWIDHPFVEPVLLTVHPLIRKFPNKRNQPASEHNITDECYLAWQICLAYDQLYSFYLPHFSRCYTPIESLILDGIRLHLDNRLSLIVGD